MKDAIRTIWGVILAWIFLMILLVFYIQARTYYGPNPILRHSQEIVEAFQTNPKIEDSENPVSAGDPLLSKPSQPYHLLQGWLNPLEKPLYPDAKRCREADFQPRLERTGNFRQLTNNYKRGDPDSCSAPIQQMTLAFYKVDPIPQTGCIQPFVE